MNDEAIEKAIQAKGLNAPRVTPAELQANIDSEHYFTAFDGVMGAYRNGNDVHPVGGTPSAQTGSALSLLTFCVLVLKNGFTVTGESACASPENFDADIGRKIARKNAEQKIWPLMGYALKERLSARSICGSLGCAGCGSQRQEGSTFVSRMSAELDELCGKLAKLGAFLDGDKASTVSEEVLSDLKLQRKAMTEYAFILSKRYDDAVAGDAA